MDLALSGRKAIIAGGSRSIGLAITKALRAEGVNVAVCARDAAGLDTARAEIEASPGSGTVFTRPTDLSDGDDTRAFVTEAILALGGLDIYVHCASGFGDQSDAGWMRTLNIDLMGAVRSVDTALDALKASGSGSIILIGSTASVQWFPRAGGASPYGPAKAAQRVLVNEYAQSLGRWGIRANVVSPGSVLSEDNNWAKVRDNQPEIWTALVKQFPFRRLVTTEEVARVVAFLASPVAMGVNGTHVVVDGGQSVAVQ